LRNWEEVGLLGEERKKRGAYREEGERIHPLPRDDGYELHFTEEGYLWRGETRLERKSHCFGLFIENAERYSALVSFCFEWEVCWLR
jgi:hypothetical protein